MIGFAKRALVVLGVVLAVAAVVFGQWTAYSLGAQATGQEPDILTFLGLPLWGLR